MALIAQPCLTMYTTSAHSHARRYSGTPQQLIKANMRAEDPSGWTFVSPPSYYPARARHDITHHLTATDMRAYSAAIGATQNAESVQVVLIAIWPSPWGTDTRNPNMAPAGPQGQPMAFCNLFNDRHDERRPHCFTSRPHSKHFTMLRPVPGQDFSSSDPPYRRRRFGLRSAEAVRQMGSWW